jgi:hypothetical protein
METTPWIVVVLLTPKNRQILLLKPYQVCNIRAKNNFGKTSDVFLISLIPKKTYAISGFQAIVHLRNCPYSTYYKRLTVAVGVSTEI